MKKVSLLVLVCMLASIMLVTLASCDSHTHTPGEAWQFDKDNHYHACICGEKFDTAAHADTNGDEACDVCGITMKHTAHNYGTAWAYDAANHYHVCDECNAKSDSAVHADANNDGACDTCGVIMANNHVYAAEWSSDASNHWHAPICGHAVANADTAAHSFNALGDCTVCGYGKGAVLDVSTTENAIAAAKLASYRVASGNFLAMDQYGSLMLQSYHFDGDYLNIFNASEGATYHINKTGEDSVYIVIDSPNGMYPIEVKPDEDIKFFGGPDVNLYSLIGQDINVYGVIDMLEFFYTEYPATADANYNTNFYDDGLSYGSYQFSYNMPYEIPYTDSTVNQYISVNFTLSEDYFIDNFSVSISWTDLEEQYHRVNIAYLQSAAIENEYSPDRTIPTEIGFKNDANETIAFTDFEAETINTSVKQYKISIEALKPSTAILAALGDVDVEIKYADGTEVPGSVASPFYFSSDNYIQITFKDEGDFVLYVGIGEDTYQIPFNVEYAIPTAFELLVFDYSWYEWAPVSERTINLYTGDTYTFAPGFAEGCEQNQYAAALTGSNAADATLQNLNELEERIAYKFSSETAGTYTVQLTSAKNANLTETVTFAVTAPPTAEELAVGKWSGSSEGGYSGSSSVTVNFYPVAGEDKGAVVVDYSATLPMWMGGGEQSATLIYTYYIKDGDFVATYLSGDDELSYATLMITANYNFAFIDVELEKVANEADDLGETVLPSEIPDPPAGVVAEPFPGLGNNAPMEAAGTLVYSGTVDANSDKVITFENFIANNITVTAVIDGEVQTIALNGNDAVISSVGNGNDTYNGQAISLTPDDWYVKFKFVNNTDSAVTVTITVTIANA